MGEEHRELSSNNFKEKITLFSTSQAGWNNFLRRAPSTLDQ